MAKLTGKAKKKSAKALAAPKAATKRSKKIDRPAGSSVAGRLAKKTIKVVITTPNPAVRATPVKSLSKTDIQALSGFVSRSAVSHRLFGPGTVLSVDGDKLEIKFKSVGVKWIVDSYLQRP